MESVSSLCLGEPRTWDAYSAPPGGLLVFKMLLDINNSLKFSLNRMEVYLLYFLTISLSIFLSLSFSSILFLPSFSSLSLSSVFFFPSHSLCVSSFSPSLPSSSFSLPPFPSTPSLSPLSPSPNEHSYLWG